MKRILLFVCVALLAWACSKDEDYDTPPLDVQEDSLWDNIIKAISDTTGLKLYGVGAAYTKDDTLACVLGAKHGKIWCGFFSEIQSGVRQAVKARSVPAIALRERNRLLFKKE